MKLKSIFRMVMLLSIFTLILPSTFAQAVTKPILGVSTIYTDKAGTVQIGIFINSDDKIASGSFELEYDATLLRIRDQDLTNGESISPAFVSTNASEEGKVTVSWAQADEKKLNGTVLTISAYVLKAGQTVNMNLENVALYNEDGSEVDVQVLDGQVKPFTGEKKVHATKEQANKVWTVTLSKDFNPATLNKYTVLVKNSRNIAVDVKLEKKNNQSFTVTPLTNYAAGKYTLEITDQLRSTNQSKLNKAIIYEFVIQ